MNFDWAPQSTKEARQEARSEASETGGPERWVGWFLCDQWSEKSFEHSLECSVTYRASWLNMRARRSGKQWDSFGYTGSSSGWAVVGRKSRGLASAPVAVSEVEENPKAGTEARWSKHTLRSTHLGTQDMRWDPSDSPSLAVCESPGRWRETREETDGETRKMWKMLKVWWKWVAF